MNNRRCPYDRARVVSVSPGHDLYPYGSVDYGIRWVCTTCRAHVGCHLNSGQPLGTVANAEDRALRNRGHELFDRQWRSGKMGRRAAYRWLQDVTGLDRSRAHFARLNGEELRRVVSLLEKEMLP